MSGQRIIEGAQEAALWVKATKSGTELPTEADRAFLDQLNETRAIANLFRVTSKIRDQVRKRCKRRGWAEFVNDRHEYGWRLTPAGRVVLDTRVHPAAVPQPASGADGGEGK